MHALQLARQRVLRRAAALAWRHERPPTKMSRRHQLPRGRVGIRLRVRVMVRVKVKVTVRSGDVWQGKGQVKSSKVKVR